MENNISELLKKPFLNEKETAELTGIAVSTLRNQRHLKQGVPYLKIGSRSVRYKLQDILAYMECRRVSFNDSPGIYGGKD